MQMASTLVSRLEVASYHRRQRQWPLPLLAQPLLGPLQLRRSAGDRAPAADLGDVVPLHRNFWLVRRLLGGLPTAPQDAVPGGHGEPRLPRPAGGLALAAARRPPLRPDRRGPRPR